MHPDDGLFDNKWNSYENKMMKKSFKASKTQSIAATNSQQEDPSGPLLSQSHPILEPLSCIHFFGNQRLQARTLHRVPLLPEIRN